jgi:hypothetical protein
MMERKKARRKRVEMRRRMGKEARKVRRMMSMEKAKRMYRILKSRMTLKLMTFDQRCAISN